jgi:hypothetical protein
LHVNPPPDETKAAPRSAHRRRRQSREGQAARQGADSVAGSSLADPVSLSAGCVAGWFICC